MHHNDDSYTNICTMNDDEQQPSIAYFVQNILQDRSFVSSVQQESSTTKTTNTTKKKNDVTMIMTTTLLLD
jgi:hypothetical protein